MPDKHSVGRRNLLKLGGAGAIGALAGCIGDLTGGGGGDGGEWQDAVAKLNLGENWEERRIGAADNWPMSERKKVPKSGDQSWTNSGAFKSAVQNDVWAPPDGWDDTPAGDVDSIQIINHGDANMEFDPATLAAHEMFTEKTGIEVKVNAIPAEQATQREQQVLSSEKKAPHAMNVDGSLVPEFVAEGWLEVTDALYPEGAYEPYIPALQNLVEWDLDSTREGTHTYGYPNIVEGTLGHLRPDLVEEQGLDPAKYAQGEWTWADLEELMKAFEGTDVFGFAYFAGSPLYLSYSFRELLYQQGGRIVQDDDTVKVNTPEAVRAVEKMREWRQKNWVPGDVLNYGEGSIVDLFTSGKLAFTTGFSDFVPSAVEQFGDDGSKYLPILPPAADEGPSPAQAALVDPNSTSINRFADTGHKLAAMLYGDVKLSYYAQWLEFTFEGNMSYMDQVYSDASESGTVKYGDVLGKAIDNGVLELFPQMSAVFQQMANPVQRAIQGETSPKEALDGVQSFVDDEVNQ